MATTPPTLLILLSLVALVATTTAQSPAAAPVALIDIIQILTNASQYTNFIRLINDTNSASQINNQANNSRDGVTLFAPTDNAFQSLPSGTLNNLTFQQHVQLVLYHTLPKYYTLDSLESVSNPVRTQATGQDNGVYGLYFYGQSNQVNVSTGIVSTTINNAVRRDFPLAVYQVDRVLLPREFYEAPAPVATPPPADGNSTRTRTGPGGAASSPAEGSPGNGAGKMSVGFGLVSAILMVCMGLF